ncbi:hypothetical protein ASD83_12500 [Devosia sp. Root685]|uniref:hypothetical protein n=1 Tax=Devosia sp. Root685 TaxID=1736587 RepID=UPI0006FAFA6F|nr:hypothetical protein [Devosia sp. Root685]KRA97890.1 hypothetical protein ASD83_12500 [Devosia sp. Root685]
MHDKAKEVSFLVDNFDIPAVKAAEVVSNDEAEIAELSARQLKNERERDPFVPESKVPVSPEEHAIKDNGGLQKTVLHKSNKAGNAGP